MSSNWKWKAIATLMSILGALYLLVPSIFNFQKMREEADQQNKNPPSYINFFPKHGVNLGLDLRGGMYLEMDVDIKEALENRVDIILLQIERSTQVKEFPDLKLNRIYNSTSVEVELAFNKRREFLDFLSENFGDVFEVAPVPEEEASLGPDDQGALKSSSRNLVLHLTEKYASHLKEMTFKQAEEAVRNRIDRYGVVEASIQRQGDERLVIELPGVKDPDRVVNVIRKTGLLEFKLLDETLDSKRLSDLIQKERLAANIPEGYSKEIVDQLNQALLGKIPEDAEVFYEIERDPVTKAIVNGVPYLLKKRSDVTGDMLRNAQVGIVDNEPRVNLSFNKMGTKNFAELTKANVGHRLAIVLDGMVSTAPVINTAIPNGEAEITLGFGSYQSLLKEAEDLALLLREGALPAALTVATKTVIGPSLGLDSITKGLSSLLIAALVIVVFMMLYYKLGGLVANFALILNVIYIFAILCLFQASLTLPGIAGIVLTLGMAVDANIIIFERMREERREGKTAKSIIESGYGHAMSAIIDSNITTLISGVVLYQFGTGPIKGFATTLVIGILTTLFTAIVVTRLIYDYFIFKRKIQKVSI